MPRLSVGDRGRAVGMLEAGMAARAIARQHNVHPTTICRRNATSDGKRERPALHQDGISVPDCSKSSASSKLEMPTTI